MEYVERDGAAFYGAATRLGLEGMVAKRRDSPYETGARSSAWLKVKASREQDFVVGGYAAGEGARAGTFGSLILGYYRGGGLVYAGRVGSGFDDTALVSLTNALSGLETSECPFGQVPEPEEGGGRHWVRPELVVRVRFALWTHDERLRSAVYAGLRPDLDPAEVGREEAQVVEAAAAPAGASRPIGPGPDDGGGVVEQLSERGESCCWRSGSTGWRLRIWTRPCGQRRTAGPP